MSQSDFRNRLLAGVAFAALATAPAFAQSAPGAAAAPADEEIVVTGQRPIRESEEAALAIQRASPSLVSVVSADAVGRLPDQNIAQAVSRLPGVAVQRDQGQARYINLRGAPLSWTTLSFDGINVVSPEGRDARFDSIPSAIASQIIVRKAVTPDMTAETIAGNVDIVTRSPFDYEGLRIAAKAGYGYVDLGGGAEYDASLMFSNRFGSDRQFGVLVSGSYYEREMATDNFETDWEIVPRDQRPDGPRVWARETENKLYRLNRKNYSVTGRLEWQPQSGQRLFATSIYSAFTDDELRNNHIFDMDDQEGRVPNAATPCPPPVPAPPAPNTTGYADVCTGNTPLIGTVFGIDNNTNYLIRNFVQSVWVNTIGGDHEFGDLKIGWRGNYTRSIDDRSNAGQLNYDSPGFGTNGANAPNRVTVAYDLSDRYLARVQLFRTLRSPTGVLSAGARVQQLEDFPLALTRVRDVDAKDTTDAYTARLDATYATSVLGDTSFSFGAQYDNREKEVDEYLLDVGTAGIAASGVNTSVNAVTIDKPYKGKLDLGYDFRYFGSGQVRSIVAQVAPFGTRRFVTENYYKVNEEVFSGYVMGLTKVEWGNIVYGARLEHVKNSSTAFSQVGLITVNNSFTSIYPSVHVNWDVTSDSKLRLSFNTGAARPDYPVLRPNFTFNDANQTVSGGNPEAKPERTWGVDAYWEMYPETGGLIAFGLFYKNASDVLFSDTRPFGSDVLNSGGVDRSEYILTSTVNGGDGYIYGAEAAFQMQIDNVSTSDKWWGGFGLQTNVTLNRSEATTPSGDKIRFPGTSDIVWNFGPYYEKYGLSVRLSYQYRSNWIDSLGTPEVGGNFYWAADDELDFSIRYGINERLEVYFDGSNLLNGAGRRFVGEDFRTLEHETFGRRFTGGFRFTY
jgi:TonB-dependent receptor